MDGVYSIAIDGPAGSGKSTVAKEVAKILGILYIDTGAMYRTVGLYCQRKNIDMTQEEAVAAVLDDMDMRITVTEGGQKISLAGEDVTQKIRSQEVGASASLVAAIPAVRQKLVELQRHLAEGNSVIMDGRDIGTNVLPNATVKLYLNASVEERAKRRCKELKELGQVPVLEEIQQKIEQRDWQDMHRVLNPLCKAKDAVVLDSSSMTVAEVVAEILKLVEQKKKG